MRLAGCEGSGAGSFDECLSTLQLAGLELDLAAGV